MTLRVPPLPVGNWQDNGQEAGEAPETTPDTAGPGTAAVVTLRGGQMSAGDQARAAAGQAYRAAALRWRELRRAEGGFIHGLITAQPPSVQDQCDYANSRAWVPPGHDGGISEGMGVVFHAVIGRPGVAVFNGLAAICARPFRAAVAVFTVLVLAVITLAIAGDTTAIAIITAVTVLTLALWAGLGVLAARSRSPRAHQQEEARD